MTNQIKTVALLGILSALLVGFGSFGGSSMMSVALIMAVVMNFVAYFFSDKIILKMHGAREIGPSDDPTLYNITKELALSAGIPMPRLYVIPSDLPNAFATGRNPAHGAVAVTEGIVRLLSTRELRGVIAHEIAHIKNRDILIATVAAMLGSAVSYLADFAQWGAILGTRDSEDGPSPLQTLALAMLAPIIALLLQMGISRSREYIADESGAKIAQDPQSLATALAKISNYTMPAPSLASNSVASLYIVNQFTGGGIMKWLSSHPPVEERVSRLIRMANRGTYLA